MREFIAGTTVSPRFDLRVGATDLEVQTILNLINISGVDSFVEIGVHEGGLAEHILTTYPRIRYMGIELYHYVVSDSIKRLVARTGNSLIYRDCMNSNTIALVSNFLTARAIVYCDNGNKKVEIIHYSKILSKGDILLTHDYLDGIRIAKDVNLDYCREVTPEDVKFLEDDPTFERLPEEMFKETRLIGWKKL